MANKSSRTILLTGAGGYIGSIMTGFFLNKGYRVTALDRFFFGEDTLKSYNTNKNFTWIKDDTRYFSKNLLKNIDIVVDLAGLSNDPCSEIDPQLTQQININGSVRVATLAKEMGIKHYLYASSCSIYGHGEQKSLTESSPINPQSLYAQCKAIVEKQVLDLADDSFTVTCARNATCYGLSHRMRYDLAVNIMTLHALKYGKILVQGGAQWRPFVHIYDVARAYDAIISAPHHIVQKNVFNVGSNKQNYTIQQLAEVIQNEIPNTELQIADTGTDIRNYNVDFSKIKNVLGFSPIKTVNDGINEIKSAYTRGNSDESIKTSTVKYYKYLLEADDLLSQVRYQGKIL